MDIRTKIRLYESLVRPLLLYGMKALALSESAKKKVDGAERRFLRMIFRARRNRSSNTWERGPFVMDKIVGTIRKSLTKMEKKVYLS